jgi:hypothetical protein
MLAPVQFKEGTGEMRWAVPRIVTDTINAISAPGKAARGDYGIEIDPETGRPTPITNDMISDTMGLAGLVGLEPAAQAGAQFGKGVIKPGASRMIQREFSNAGIDPAQVPSIMRSMGPDTMVADLSPGLQARAAAIATMPGSGQKTIVDALAARRAGANVRIQTGVDDVLGPAVSPTAFNQGIRDAQRALSPQYEAVLADAQPVDVSSIANAIDGLEVDASGDIASALAKVRGMLDDRGVSMPKAFGTALDVKAPLISNPRQLLNVRQDLDDLVGAAQGNQKRVLRNVRQLIDDELKRAVPGIKDVDAQYELLAKQRDAFETGQQALDSGRTALTPSDLVTARDGSPAEVLSAMSAGTRADIDRIVGTNTNDITAMKRILQGEGNWNRDRLRTQFGEEKAAKLLEIFEREARQHATEQLALQGSRTQVLKAAQEDIVGKGPRANPVRSLGDLKFGTAAADFLDNGFGWLSANKRASTNNQVAQALMARAADAPLMNELAIPARDGRKAVNLALLRAMALGNEGYAESFGTPYRAVNGR